MARDQCLQLADDLDVTRLRQVGLDAHLDHSQAELVQPGDLGDGERFL